MEHWISAVLFFLNQNGSAISAVSGLVVAIFTGTLWWVTRDLADSGEKQRADLLRSITAAEAAAEAAKLSASTAQSALLDLERAYIFVASIKCDIGRFLQPRTLWSEENARPEFVFKVVNHGRTPGNIIEAFFCMEVLENEPSNDRDAVDLDGKDGEAAEIIIGPSIEFSFPMQMCRHKLSYKMAEAIVLDQAHLYCYGWFLYRDIFSKIHTTAFCRRFEKHFNEWVPAGGIAKNLSN